MEEIRNDKKAITDSETMTLDHDAGKVTNIDDVEVDTFYGSSTTKAYRLKSELIGKCMEDIGMGWFQWKLFVVTGFGWIVDNV